MNFFRPILIIFLLSAFVSCTSGQSNSGKKDAHAFEISKTDEEWKKTLTSEQYFVLREKGTERAFTGALWDNKKDGVYSCAACGQPVFSSETKFVSGSGWPSFYEPFQDTNVLVEEDRSLGMVREEVLCSRCGGHLGHVFPDGPEPTGLRYCINSAALSFTEDN